MNTTTFAPPTSDSDSHRAPQRVEALLARARRAGMAIWRGLEAYGRARAQRELRDLHDRWASSDPELAKRMRAANDFLVVEGIRRDA